jgi:L-alanine-DL-glutamate epimerase-like enolase superfamily enzyme
MGSAIPVAIESIDFFMRNVSMRLPFRYGKACLVAAPLFHVRLMARSAEGGAAYGTSADMLPPKWFDKAPDKSYRRNISDLILAAKTGAQAYRDIGAQLRSPFELWREASDVTMEAASLVGLNGLTGSFGSSIIERALIDATGKFAGTDLHTMLRENILGIDPGAVHEELRDRRPADSMAVTPTRSLFIRHTVGLGDPIRDADIGPDDRLDDGIPQSLESWIREAGVRYFKIKVSADLNADRARLAAIAQLLDEALPEKYQVTLDGNEQFPSCDALESWYAAMEFEKDLRNLLGRVIFIEQPIERTSALSPEAAAGLERAGELPPVIIDESDDSIDSFKRAVALGYRGTSVKNCKGVLKGFLNKMLVDHFNGLGNGYLLSGEDLCNQPIVPLQQDLCTLGALGLTHAERNGHHYCGTLDHLSPFELADCLDAHGTLYEPFGQSARLRIRDGRINLVSLEQPGFGLGIDTDYDHMTPLADWEYESLDIDEG